jgi:hypothetical protein
VVPQMFTIQNQRDVRKLVRDGVEVSITRLDCFLRLAAARSGFGNAAPIFIFYLKTTHQT